MTKTTAIILVIASIVVSAAIVAFSIRQKTILDWFNSMMAKGEEIASGEAQTVSRQRTYNINEVAGELSKGYQQMQQ